MGEWKLLLLLRTAYSFDFYGRGCWFEVAGGLHGFGVAMTRLTKKIRSGFVFLEFPPFRAVLCSVAGRTSILNI